MKKILALSIALCTVSLGFAQGAKTVERIKSVDTVTNADTAYLAFNSVASGVKSIQVAATKISGTVAGTAFIQGTVDGTNWVSVTDTLTLANQAVNTKIWLFTATTYNSYRACIISSGTMKAAVSAALLRRTDE